MSKLCALSLLVVAACGGGSPSPAKPAPAAGDDQTLCVESFTHNRTCTAEYIPSLVDSRAKLDLPPGMADMVKQDRAGVIAKANAEWAEDSKDENIARHCQQMTAHLTDDARALEGEVRQCLPMTDCAAYVACMSPIQEKLLAHGPPHP